MQTTVMVWPSYPRPADRELPEGKFTVSFWYLEDLVMQTDHKAPGTQEPAGLIGRCRRTHLEFPRAPVQAGAWGMGSMPPPIIKALSMHLTGLNFAAVPAQRPGIWISYPNPNLSGGFPFHFPRSSHPLLRLAGAVVTWGQLQRS